MFKTTLLGRIGKDAEKKDHNGNVIISFSLAYSEKKAGQDVTTWVNCSLFRKPDKAGILPYLCKGQQVLVEGKISANAYMSKDGTPTASLNLYVNDLHLVGGKSDAQKASPPQVEYPAKTQAKPVAKEFADVEVEEDMPF